MKKIFVLLCFAGILSGCDETDSESAYSRITGIHVICLQGVEYYDGWRTLAVKYNTDGNISLCEEKGE